MQLSAFLRDVAANYDRSAGLESPTQLLLRSAGEHLEHYAPGGFLVRGSGGKGMATYTPWVGFFDPEVTDNPQEGIYVVFLFSEDLQTVALSLNQGIEYLRREHGDARARAVLSADAARIREALPHALVARFADPIHLNSRGARQLAYMAGSVACRNYVTDSLPGDEALARDLLDMLDLYGLAAAIKDQLLVTDPGTVSTPGRKQLPPAGEHGFRPKDDADYIANIGRHTKAKTRRHETLVNRYAEWAQANGFTVSSPHPVDLRLASSAHVVIVEAKVVRAGNASHAVREAIGQLFTYRHFLYRDSAVALVALFTEDIGPAYTELLASLGIRSVWAHRGQWQGSAVATALGLTSVRF